MISIRMEGLKKENAETSKQKKNKRGNPKEKERASGMEGHLPGRNTQILSFASAAFHLLSILVTC
jgi:hypothetical protein